MAHHNPNLRSPTCHAGHHHHISKTADSYHATPKSAKPQLRTSNTCEKHNAH
ncbi:hypothetical protein M011DRAFT_468718 [Sporormia fimetaria CBS 119925]|uniref:Uncharacterized protein n=1 Tax=Sporormia fimetaria CBS 119925 TaxID=1340428 RepID=A0A6A6V8L5_9PLEO|nr:hypothetical protein M011DRAFT_468718 [Sporormia fimetaria CBS 119925]